MPEDELPAEENANDDFDAVDADESITPARTQSDFLPYTDNLPAVRNQLRGMYQSWFLEYASYVILERAVPHIDDGLKPVQRRILHSMKTLDDGRFNKVANIVGNTKSYHPHCDGSINAA
ncbi:MAG: DNA gyrase/topoisomerase IV subunit A, partial [Muribaculaceae bacterium]|nr:DNA gyrase/topoisomerase IV subunit A [Muribaculaceae bacterium]